MLTPNGPSKAGALRPRVLIVSNRLPAVLRVREGEASLLPASGGLATAMGTVHDQGGHLWIGSLGDTSRLTAAQSADLRQRLALQRLRDVELSAEQVRAYYEDFSNGVLWPLFHYMPDRIPLDSRGWQTYYDVNERFADVVAAEHRPDDLIWVHDYQLLLLPWLLRQRLPSARIGFFLHIPFPSFEVFRMLPWREHVLGGMLGADLIGFHTVAYVRYFTRALQYILGHQTEVDSVRIGSRDVRLRAFPLGVDVNAYERLAADAAVQKERTKIREGAGNRQIVLGVDRLDYTKGIPRRLLAFERMLEREPPLRDQVRLVQVAVPSRSSVETYKTFRKQLDEMVGRINGRFGTAASVPIHYLYRAISPQQLVGLYTAADVMAVTPLRDGMNLVAKEFVASRVDEDGVLLLSEFAGAAEELIEAVQVNPYDIDAVAGAMRSALKMPPEDRQARMRALRQRVGSQTVQRWAETFMQELGGIPEAAAVHTAADAPAASLAEQVLARAAPVLLLDYDGTLVPIASAPDLARPDAGVQLLLRSLAAMMDVHVISGRGRADLSAWFSDAPLTLWAEHGAWLRPGGGTWERTSNPPTDWMLPARELLRRFASRTPGAILEEKDLSLAWHYRTVDPEFATRQLQLLKEALIPLLKSHPLDVLEGHKVLEVRPHGVSKAVVAQRILEAGAAPEQIIAIGDDRTDEEMFAALAPESLTIRVGPGATAAQFRLEDPRSVRRLLQSLIDRAAA